MKRARAVAGLGLSFYAAGCSALEPPVARQVDGVVSEGRFIEPEAYASYAAAALQEARGEWREALELYQRALEADDRGPELHTRIGAVACRLRSSALADRAFHAAARAAADYGPLWFELALCRRSRGDLAGAQTAALEAVRLDPERAEASLLAASLSEQRGDEALARQLRDGLATHAPSSVPVQTNLLAAALRSKDEARALRARAALEALTARTGAARAPGGLALALSALERGDLSTAKQQAERLLGADPGHGDALVIALAVADLRQDEPAFEALLASSAAMGTPVSPELKRWLAALIARRVNGAEQLLSP